MFLAGLGPIVRMIIRILKQEEKKKKIFFGGSRGLSELIVRIDRQNS